MVEFPVGIEGGGQRGVDVLGAVDAAGELRWAVWVVVPGALVGGGDGASRVEHGHLRRPVQ